MAKKVKRVVKLELEAGKANPARVGKDLAHRHQFDAILHTVQRID